MKKTQVTVEWEHGLHMLPASRLARIAQDFAGSLAVTYGSMRVDAASVLNLMTLGAPSGSILQIEASGPREQEAIRAVKGFFRMPEEAVADA